MTLVPHFLSRIRLLLQVLSIVALFGLISSNSSVSAQTAGYKPNPNEHVYTLVQNPDGSTTCRLATAQERKEMRDQGEQPLHLINHLKDTEKGPSANVNDPTLPGLKIFLLGTTQLENNQQAKAAFIRAAADWEAIIKSPITIYLRVDFGPQNFGAPWGQGVIGSTSSFDTSVSYPTVRSTLITAASNGSESSLYALLPQSSVPTDAGNSGTMVVSTSIARALGFLPANADPNNQNTMPRIGFNSAKTYDFNPDDGISGGTDFVAVATHEIGHALGFVSSNGEGGTPPRLAMWDLFRFRPGISDFTNTQRISTVGGGLQIFYAGGPELGLSTGGPDGEEGDGEQSSHWREDNNSTLAYIGIMDPTIAPNRREQITVNDINALNFMGYNMEGSVPPPPPPPPPPAPANNNFSSAQVITGCSGSVTGTNISATKEAGEPSHSPDNNPGGASVWYQWQAPSTGSVTITTAGSNYDTLLAVYTGNSVGGLSLIQRNDDASVTPHVVSSSVTFNATSGVTYRIAVDGYDNNSGGDTGNIVLNWNATNCTSGCTYAISPTSQNFAPGGGTGTVNVTSDSGCNWTAVSNSPFIAITSGANGTGNGTVGYSVAANSTTATRSGTITIAGQTFTVTQDGASCSYSINPTSQNAAASGSTGSTNVTAIGGCAWVASSNDSWITVTSGSSGTGNGTVNFAIAANSGPSRNGTLTIAGQTFTVTQASGCTYSISPTTLNHASGGGTGTVSVTPSGACPWTAVSNSPFIAITSGANGTGNGTVGYSVAANSTTATRSGTITIAGQTFTVTQDGICIYSINPTSQNFGVSGSLGIVNVTATGTCGGWTAVSNNPFITITSGASGTGNGTVGFSISANPNPGQRLGTMTIAGQTFSISQDGVNCSYLIGSTAQSFNAGGGAGSVNLSATGGCPWSATSNASWLTITSVASGTGNSTVNYTVAANTGVARTGTLTIAGQIFTVTQGAAGPSVQFELTGYSVNEAQSFATVTVTRSGDLSGVSTIKYATSDLTDVNFKCDPTTAGQATIYASRKCDYHIAVGRLRFAAGESSKQFTLSIVNDVYVEGPEALTLTLSNPVGAILGQNSTVSVTLTDDDTYGTSNPVDNTRFFVRQLYVDLLSREPDPAGWNGWTDRINLCGQQGQAPPPCDRVTVAGDGFLRSGEFFDRQFFVLRLYRTGLGRILRYEDVGDLAYVSGFLTAEQLELNKQDLVDEFVARPEFSNQYGPLSNAAFVTTLLQTAGVSIPLGIQSDWVTSLDTNSKTRAKVFREISERQEVSARYAHEAQVVSAYYGFFTRNPDGAYLNYLQRLDSGEITLGDLANAFINAAEYRSRFGQ